MTGSSTSPQQTQPMNGNSQEFRKLPAVDALLHQQAFQPLLRLYGTQSVTDAIRHALDAARAAIQEGGEAPPADSWYQVIEGKLRARYRSTLQRAINATGVIIHTNLGRAPLSAAAQAAVQRLTTGYTNLEYDLDAGQRGSRHIHAQRRLCDLTGAEDALVVNNNASAVYLALAALCQTREVVISRGQLVEIGGGFRIPDVLRQSGAHLIEVGTTNRTHLRDFAQALGPETAALMRVHASNFRQIGFVTEPSLAELVAIAHDHRAADGSRPFVIDDLGSGTLLDTTAYGLAPEPTVQASVEAGADVITFSGDKLLGGPQAGLIVGKADVIARLRRHPMARALRVDKMTLAALDATLRAYQRGHAAEEIPVWRMIATTGDAIADRAARWQQWLADAGIAASLRAGESTVGGGSLPGETLPTTLLALKPDGADNAAARLRAADPPVICRIQDDHLLFDPRTVLPEEDDLLLSALAALGED